MSRKVFEKKKTNIFDNFVFDGGGGGGSGCV